MTARASVPAPVTILLVDDDPSIRLASALLLERAGYRVLHAADGEEALACVAREQPALLVMDLDMPRMDGIEAVRCLRKAGNRVPVLMLTGLNDVDRRVNGLFAGADDYLGKPCDGRELLARAGALLRRVQQEPAVRRLVFGGVTVDLAAQTAERAGLPLRLTRKEFSILNVLARRAGRPVGREAMLQEVWGYAGTAHTRTLDTHVWRLRRKLDDDGENPRWIRSVPGIGYTLDKTAVSAG